VSEILCWLQDNGQHEEVVLLVYPENGFSAGVVLGRMGPSENLLFLLSEFSKKIPSRMGKLDIIGPSVREAPFTLLSPHSPIVWACLTFRVYSEKQIEPEEWPKKVQALLAKLGVEFQPPSPRKSQDHAS